MKQVFESENIRFVHVSEQLVSDYLTMVNDFENVNRWIGSKDKKYNEEQELAWMREKLEENAPVFSMIEKKSGEFIGNIELMDMNESSGELGIAITAAKQEQGYGTEAIQAFVKYCAAQFGISKICLRAMPYNSRAIHVYQKCGFLEYQRTERFVFMERSVAPEMDISTLMFFDGHAEALELYRCFETILYKSFPMVNKRVQKTQITFTNRHVFVCVSFARVKKKALLPPGYMVITIGLPGPLDSARVAVKSEPYPNRWTHHIVVSKAEELDEELMSWIREAYDFADSK